MQDTKSLTGTYVETDSSIRNAKSLPKLTHAEATRLANDELEGMMALLDDLTEQEWKLPTVCTEWNVTQMVAHLAGAFAGYASWGQMKRQFLTNPYSKTATAKVHAISQCQVEDRDGVSPEALLAELREVGPRAIRVRNRLPWALRVMPVPLGEPLGFAPVGLLTDLIYTRDTWMHRLDISRAAGRDMKLTAAHDGRIVDLVMRDLAKTLHGRMGNRNIRVELTGPAGGSFDFGSGSAPSATIRLDALDFNWLASGRTTPERIMPDVQITGDREHAEWFLAHAEVPF